MKKVTYIFTLHIIQGICEENKSVIIKKVLSCEKIAFFMKNCYNGQNMKRRR